MIIGVFKKYTNYQMFELRIKILILNQIRVIYVKVLERQSL